jgi:2-polyprenyl-3-methyl-5-hydroxy-6-metoxy-1,4-benzoquinol methylase
MLRSILSRPRVLCPTRLYTTSSPKPSFSTIDKAEVQKFSDKAAEWWDPAGEFSMLQLLNPPRVSYVRDQLVGKDSELAKSGKPFQGLKMLDIGCGGGLLSEVRQKTKVAFLTVQILNA